MDDQQIAQEEAARIEQVEEVAQSEADPVPEVAPELVEEQKAEQVPEPEPETKNAIKHEVDVALLTDDELERMVGEKIELVKQRKSQQEALKAMIAEQEQEFLQVSQRNETSERDYYRARQNFEGASKTLQRNLETKEALFTKLQKLQEEIDTYN